MDPEDLICLYFFIVIKKQNRILGWVLDFERNMYFLKVN